MGFERGSGRGAPRGRGGSRGGFRGGRGGSRDFGDRDDHRGGSRDFGDRRGGSRDFGDRRGGDRDGGFRPRPSYGDREGGDRPRPSYGDRDGGDRPRYGDREGGFRGGDRGGRGGFRGGRGGDRGRGGFRGGRGGDRGGRGGFRGGERGGFKGGAPFARGGFKSAVTPHPRFPGVYISNDMFLTKSLAPGQTVYGEKKVQVEEGEQKIEYREWNPWRSKLCAAIAANIEQIYIQPGSRVLYLGAASGTTVSHVSDLVGPEGVVYAVEFSETSGKDLVMVASQRNNIVPIIEDARHPQKYSALISPMVDVIFSDVAQPDQARIVALNAKYFLKESGGFCMAIKANCISSTREPEKVYTDEIEKLREEGFTPKEKVTLEPFERAHACISGVYKGA